MRGREIVEERRALTPSPDLRGVSRTFSRSLATVSSTSQRSATCVTNGVTELCNGMKSVRCKSASRNRSARFLLLPVFTSSISQGLSRLELLRYDRFPPAAG